MMQVCLLHAKPPAPCGCHAPSLLASMQRDHIAPKLPMWLRLTHRWPSAHVCCLCSRDICSRACRSKAPRHGSGVLEGRDSNGRRAARCRQQPCACLCTPACHRAVAWPCNAAARAARRQPATARWWYAPDGARPPVAAPSQPPGAQPFRLLRLLASHRWQHAGCGHICSVPQHLEPRPVGAPQRLITQPWARAFWRLRGLARGNAAGLVLQPTAVVFCFRGSGPHTERAVGGSRARRRRRRHGGGAAGPAHGGGLPARRAAL